MCYTRSVKCRSSWLDAHLLNTVIYIPVIVKLILKPIVEGGDGLDRPTCRNQSTNKTYSPFFAEANPNTM